MSDRRVDQHQRYQKNIKSWLMLLHGASKNRQHALE